MIKCSEVLLPVGGHSKFDAKAKGSRTNLWMWFQMRVLGSLDVFPRLLSWTQDQCQLLYCQQSPSWRSTEGFGLCYSFVGHWVDNFIASLYTNCTTHNQSGTAVDAVEAQWAGKLSLEYPDSPKKNELQLEGPLLYKDSWCFMTSRLRWCLM